MRSATTVLAAACLFAVLPSTSHAQRVPFFGGGNTAFDPEISVVNSGDLLDAQVAVSPDLKYVTINARPSSSRLLALREFTFQGQVGAGPQLGFVGGPDVAAGLGPLGRRGMRFIGRLDDDDNDDNPPRPSRD